MDFSLEAHRRVSSMRVIEHVLRKEQANLHDSMYNELFARVSEKPTKQLIIIRNGVISREGRDRVVSEISATK